MDNISQLASVNTGIAVGIAVLKGFGLPEKKGMERMTLGKLTARVRQTTRKLKAGMDVDASKEAEDVRIAFEGAEVDARFEGRDFVKAVEGGLAAGKAGWKKG
jgi:hypothetical protein